MPVDRFAKVFAKSGKSVRDLYGIILRDRGIDCVRLNPSRGSESTGVAGIFTAGCLH